MLPWRIALLLLALLCSAHADKGFAPFEVEGRYVVKKAAILPDGGSIALILKNDFNTILLAGHNRRRSGGKHNEMLWIRRLEDEKSFHFKRGSIQEHHFLYFLAGACAHSYGTVDTERLRTGALNKDGKISNSSRAAMAELFRRFEAASPLPQADNSPDPEIPSTSAPAETSTARAGSE